MFNNLIHIILFYTITIFMIISSLGIIFLPNLLHACISMFFAFLAGGMLFILLDSDFIGISQIAVYSIAVCILFSIIIMLSGQKINKIEIKPFLPKISLAVFSVSILFFVILFSLTNGFTLFNKFNLPFSMGLNIADLGLKIPESYSIKLLAVNLLSKYIFPFELISLIIIIALIGVVVLNSLKQFEKEEQENE